MRNLSESVLQAQGLEPVNLIEIEWYPGTFVVYSDRMEMGGEARILELGNLNSVLRVDGAGVAESITIKLDDTDGVLKQIYDGMDIHKRRVVIYQAFVGHPDQYVLFEGQIASPIVWSEAERHLSFSVTTKVEDIEVGFAPEDGQFSNLPTSMLGKPWPIIFGTARYIPTVPLDEPMSAILITPFGIPDHSIPEQILRLRTQMQEGTEPFVGVFYRGSDVSTMEETNQHLREDLAKLLAWQASVQAQRDSIMPQIEALEDTLAEQDLWSANRKTIRVIMDNMEPGNYVIRINEMLFNASFTAAGIMTIEIPPPAAGEATYTLSRFSDIEDNFHGAVLPKGFHFFNAGTVITVVSAYQLPYLVCANNGLVLNVYAYRNYEGLRKLTPLPRDFYTINYGFIEPRLLPISPYSLPPVSNNYSKTQWFSPIAIVLKRPLSTTSFLKNRAKVSLDQYIQEKLDLEGPEQPKFVWQEEWEDQLYVDVQSSTPINPVYIIQWLILNFSYYLIDTASFAQAAYFTQYYRADFALYEKKSLIALINEIAIQARCVVWVKNYKFYIRFLPAEPDSVDTITDNDIIHGSLQLTSSDTEEIVTKYTAIYKSNNLPDTTETKIVLKNNVPKYGIQEEEVNYFIFSAHYSVKKAATYWLIRKSNSWKKINFKTPLHKLNLETMDCVTIDLTMAPIANTPVKGIIESAVYDSDSNEIDMTVWLPVRLGEMNQYIFAWPAGATAQDIFPTDIGTKGGGSGNLISTNPQQLTRNRNNRRPDTTSSGFNPSNTGDEKRIIDSSDRPDVSGVLRPSDLIEVDPIYNNYEDNSPNIDVVEEPTWDYKLRDAVIPPPDFPLTNISGVSVYPGFVVGGGGDNYTVSIYKEGLDGPAIAVAVKQIQISPAETIPVGTAALIIEARVIDEDATPDENGIKPKKTIYYMQVPIWLQ